MKKSNTQKPSIVALLLAGALATAGCPDEAESAADNVEDAVEDAGDAVDDAVDDAADAVDDAIDD